MDWTTGLTDFYLKHTAVADLGGGGFLGFHGTGPPFGLDQERIRTKKQRKSA